MESSKITTLQPYVKTGLCELKKHAHLKGSVRVLFDQTLKKSFWEKLLAVTGRQFDEKVQSLLHREVMLDDESARQLARGSRVPELQTYLATVVVLKLTLESVDLTKEERRMAVVEALRLATTRIRCVTCERHEGIDQPELTADEWELLRCVHTSVPWFDVVRQPTPDLQIKHERLRKVAVQILVERNPRLATASSERQNERADRLIRLVEDWHPAWTMCFAAIPMKWRF